MQQHNGTAADSFCSAHDISMLQRLVEARPDRLPTVNDIFQHDPIKDNKLGMTTLIKFADAELRLIVDWAKQLPGFTSLGLEDQESLLTSSFVELIIFRLAFRSRQLDKCVYLANELMLTVEDCTGLYWGEDLFNGTLAFIKKLQELDLDHVEFCLLNGILLTYPDATGLNNKESVMKLQSLILDVLQQYVSQTYPSQSRRFGKMLLRLPCLRTISSIASEKLQEVCLGDDNDTQYLVLEMVK